MFMLKARNFPVGACSRRPEAIQQTISPDSRIAQARPSSSQSGVSSSSPSYRQAMASPRCPVVVALTKRSRPSGVPSAASLPTPQQTTSPDSRNAQVEFLPALTLR